MIGPGDLLRLPVDTAEAVRRVVREVVVIRTLLERTNELLEVELVALRTEVVHLRLRVDEVADSMPTQEDGGALTKVKDALTGSSDSRG